MANSNIDISGDALARDILLHDVAPVATEILLKHIEKDIYNAYSPSFYTRRYSLVSDGNIYTKMIDDNTLFITSVAQPNKPHTGWSSQGPGSFLQMLEEGNMGWWKKGFARPAISNAQHEVDNSQKIIQAINRGKKRLGI